MKTPIAGSRPVRQFLALVMLAVLLTGMVRAVFSANLAAPTRAFANPAFEGVWQRADRPVAERAAVRSWLWGEAPSTTTYEPYAQGTQGNRQVQYFDKSRMEINHPEADRDNPYYVTNGLLAVEMMSGRLQVGDAEFDYAAPASVPIAGDLDDPAQSAPTYAAMSRVASLQGENRAESLAPGTPLAATLSTTGEVNPTGGPADLAQVAVYSPDTGHNIADVFWTFLNSEGLVYEGGKLVRARLMDWIFVMGYPITEPYWTRIRVGGAERVVLVQAFQRRVLTYSPNNPDGWKVEMGNVGLHYYAWRYEQHSTGFVFLNGKYQEPPYRVERNGVDILINGAVVRSGRIFSGDPLPDLPPAQPKDASDLVSIACYRLWELKARTIEEVTPQVRANIIDLIKSYPIAADVQDLGGSLLVTDTAGGKARVVFPTVAPPTLDEVYQGLATTVEEWRALLRTGGTLLVSQSATMEVPPVRTPGFLESLLAAYSLTEAERRAKLDELTGAPPITADLLAAGAPPVSLRARVPPRGPEPTPAATVQTVEGKGASGLFAPTGSGRHYVSQTPGRDRAYIFLTLNISGESTPVKQAARLHGYHVIEYEANTFDPGSSTIDNFLGASGEAGILYLASHGDSVALDLEQHDTKVQRDAAWQRYADRGYNLIKGQVPAGFRGWSTDYTLAMDAAFIQTHWRDADTIVQIAACEAEALAPSFGAREAIAYPTTLLNSVPRRDNPGFWGRLDGTLANGSERNVVDAFNVSMKDRGWTLQGRGGGRTVLSPAVATHTPEQGAQVQVGKVVGVTVVFDTRMDTRWYPTLVNGCEAIVSSARWLNESTYVFNVLPLQSGVATIGVDGILSRSKASLRYPFQDQFGRLDGSTNPYATDHVGPNGDDYLWHVDCVAPFPPPSTTTPHPTLTPYPSSTPQATNTRAATASPTSTPSPTATRTVAPATSPSTTTPTPGSYFTGIYLDISATDPAQHATYYEVRFTDPALEAQRGQYQYGWALVVPDGDQCAVYPLEYAPEAWRTRWRHPDCVHSPGEQIGVLVQRGGAAVNMIGPALGPAQVTPTP